MNDFHLGKLIQEKIEEKKMPIAEFARLIHCERSNVYSIFKRKSIDIEKLVLISKTLDFDFIYEYYLKSYTQETSVTFTVSLKGNKLKVVQHVNE